MSTYGKKLIIGCAAALLAAAPAQALTPARIIGVNGAPTENGTLTIAFGSNVLDVTITAGMTCDQICQAVQNAASTFAGGTFWGDAQIDCLQNGYCYIRIRDGRPGHIGGHLAKPTVTASDANGESIDGVTFSNPQLENAVIKISNITAAPPQSGDPMTWEACITISVNGNQRQFCITVDDDVTPPGEGEYPSTAEEICDTFLAAIDADPDLMAEKNEDGQIFVYFEGPEILTIRFVSATAPYDEENDPEAHALVLAAVPDSGPIEGGQESEVYCSHVGPGATFLFGELPADVLDYDDTRQVYTVLAPPGMESGSVPIIGILADGSSDMYSTVPDGYRYEDVIPVPAGSLWMTVVGGGVLVLVGLAVMRRLGSEGVA